MSTAFEVFPLGEVVKPTRPRVKPSDYAQLPFIGMEHIEAHSMKLLGTASAGTMKSSAVHFKPGDVLYGRLRPYLNKVFRPTFEGLCSAEFIVLPENERVEGAYLQYFLNSSAFVRYASHLNAGDRPRVDFDQLAQYQIPLPERPEQRRIVADIEKQFSRLDEAAANLKRIKAHLKRYRACVFKAAVEGRLVPTEAEVARREGRTYEQGAQLLERIVEAGHGWRKTKRAKSERPASTSAVQPELPEGWVWTRLEDVADRVTKGSSPNWQGFAYRDQGIPFVRSQNVGWGVTDLSGITFLPPAFNEVEKKSVLREGDVLLNIVGASIGRAAIAPKTVEGGNVNQAVAVIRVLDIGVSNQFVLLHLLSGETQRRIHEAKVDVARANFSLEDIKQLPFPLPPLAEQHRIVGEVERRLSIMREIESEVDLNLRRARTLRRAVLAQAFKTAHAA